jgi:hypothetical protein
MDKQLKGYNHSRASEWQHVLVLITSQHKKHHFTFSKIFKPVNNNTERQRFGLVQWLC